MLQLKNPFFSCCFNSKQHFKFGFLSQNVIYIEHTEKYIAQPKGLQKILMFGHLNRF